MTYITIDCADGVEVKANYDRTVSVELDIHENKIIDVLVEFAKECNAGEALSALLELPGWEDEVEATRGDA